MPPWWGWVIIAVISGIALVTVVTFLAVGGGLLHLWREDKRTARRQASGHRRYPNRWSL